MKNEEIFSGNEEHIETTIKTALQKCNHVNYPNIHGIISTQEGFRITKEVIRKYMILYQLTVIAAIQFLESELW